MLNILFPLTKVEEGEQRLVFGRAAACVPDRSNEVMDWDTGKAAIKDWSDECAKVSGGKSLGNVRMMHDAKRVVGRLVDIQFDDMAKAVDVTAHIVEDAAWHLCKTGCIGGFSIGGAYKRKWPDPQNPKLTKYTPSLAELSIVDRPCMPDAVIRMVKMDGTEELVKVTGRARDFAEIYAARPRDFATIWDEFLAKHAGGR